MAVVRDKEEAMHPRWIFAVILGTFPAAAASAQQSHLDMRRQIEQLAATFSERYNKQDAGAGHQSPNAWSGLHRDREERP